MIRRFMSLFRSSDAADASAPYQHLVDLAREKAWYTEGQVADDMDGRFAVLASLVALTILRLEEGDEDAVRGSVALTEQYISDMDAQMREIGFDTTIGKQVRGLVGALATRVDRWRRAEEGEVEWEAATLFSVYRDKDPGETALTFASEKLRSFREHLDGYGDEEIMRGDFA